MTEIVQSGINDASLRDILHRVYAQRMERYTDIGPTLSPNGSAKFRHDGTRLMIAYASAHPNMADIVVDRITSYARLRGLHTVWTVLPETPDGAEFSQALTRAGLKLDEALVLMARAGKLSAPVDPSVRVIPITHWDGMVAYERGSRQSFYDDLNPDPDYVSARARERWRQQEMGWYRYFVAVLDGHIVGGCYVSLWEEIPTIMGVYTLKEARRHGVATATLSYAINVLVESGKDRYCLFVKHDNPALSLYGRLGFVRLAAEETFVQQGSS